MSDPTGSARAGVNPGDVLAGKYRVDRVIGEGGMGLVVSAYHLQLDEQVALKFLLPDVLGNQEAVARFAREARAAVKIKSEHVARVIDVGTLETGSPYMVMEFLRGGDLGDLVQRRGPLPMEEAVEYLLQASEALAEAHSLGIVHRDLKPANLFLVQRADGSPCVKVLDFGISKMTRGADSSMGMTKTAVMMGSPLYMSPEQMASSRDVDARADIWALGAILYELLTGRVPFMADSMPQLCAMILQQDPEPLRNIRPDLPPGIENVIAVCLRKSPKDRYPTIAELAQALVPYAPRRSMISVERVSRVMQAAGLSTSDLEIPASLPPGPSLARSAGGTNTNWGQTAGPGTGRKNWLIAAVLGTVLAGGAAGALLLTRSHAEPATTDSSATAAQPPPLVEAPPSARTVEPAPKVEPTAQISPQPSAAPSAAVPPPVAVAKPFRASSTRPAGKPKPELAKEPAKPAKPASLVDLYGDRK